MLIIGNCLVINSCFFLDIMSIDANATENLIGFTWNLCSHDISVFENGPFSIFPYFKIQVSGQAQILKIWFLPELVRKYLYFTQRKEIFQKNSIWSILAPF